MILNYSDIIRFFSLEHGHLRHLMRPSCINHKLSLTAYKLTHLLYHKALYNNKLFSFDFSI